MGYSGVDLNMGCPVKTVIKNGACAALINNRQLAGAIIDATREAAGEHFPVSVKTRVGFTTVDMGWINFLLSKKILNMLSIHGRTAKELSAVPANWDLIGQAAELRDSLSPSTLIVGNGDIISRQQAEDLAKKHRLDGVMIGRGIFHDPFIFSENSRWEKWSKQQKLGLFAEHIELYKNTYTGNERRFEALRKFCKVYINGFDGASELRTKFMETKDPNQALFLLKSSS
jgi:tRNA-dihydrouridine synthase